MTSAPHMMGESFTLSYTDSGMSSSSSVFSLDPLKAERLEQRLTAGANAILNTTQSVPSPHLLPVPTQSMGPPLAMSVEKEELNSDDESHRGSDDNSDHRRDDGSKSLKASQRRRFTKQEDDTLMEGHNKFGTEWEKIVSWGNLDRTVEQLKRRFTRIKKRHHKDEDGPARDGQPKESSSEPPKKIQKLNPPSPIAAVETEPIVPKKEWEDLKAHQEEIRVEKERLQALQTSLNEREQALLKREQLLKNYEETVQTRMRQTLEGLLIEQAERDREEARRTVMRDCTRLGQLIFERHGTLTTEYHEVWRDGSGFKELKKKREHIAAERNAIEAERKQLKKSRAGTKGDGQEAAGEEHILQQEEILRLRLQALKKDEADLNAQHAKLVFEKKLHLREMKRCSDEENSRFNSHPTLNTRYLLLNLLGKGGFSEVYKAFDLVEFRMVACKIHQLNTNWSETKKQNYTKHAVREYNIHKDLNHPGVVSLFDVFKIDNNSFCTVLEYCDGGDLDLYLKTRNKLQEREAKVIIAQIFSGLKYLNTQKRPIIHYDLKPGNILFSDGAVKITDFGLSKIMEENSNQMELTSQGAGTYWYLPPECFEVGKAPPRISSKVDVWSAGVIFYQLLYGKKPFGNNCSQQKLLVDHVITNAAAVEFPKSPTVSDKGKNFIRRCLTPSQAERPDVLTICTDPYLKITRQPKNKKGEKEEKKKED